MIKQCKQCGKEFETQTRKTFCPECKKARRVEQQRRYANSEQGKEAKERHNAKRRKNPKSPKPLPEFNTCGICGKKFKPSYPREHFCSDDCRFNSPLARAFFGDDIDLYR